MRLLIVGIALLLFGISSIVGVFALIDAATGARAAALAVETVITIVFVGFAIGYAVRGPRTALRMLSGALVGAVVAAVGVYFGTRVDLPFEIAIASVDPLVGNNSLVALVASVGAIFGPLVRRGA